MKKLLAPTVVVAVFMAGVVFAGGPAAGPTAAFTTGSPATTNNDDSCDIGTYPAATLLLPYFEVDVRSPQTTAQTTLFTIVNVSHIPQIAHVTIWSDWAYPALDFNLFLTGYDVQAINMYDVLVRGIIAPPGGTSDTTTPGTLSAANNANSNFGASAASSCASLPGAIPASLLLEIQNILTNGGTSNTCAIAVGSIHPNAVGYVTIDVVSTCSVTLPTDSNYYRGQILFDNVLTGDYEQINPNPETGNYAGGSPLVHIRAIPEGGPAGSTPGTNLPYTFYDRYTNQVAAGIPRTIDRRQPLPSSFAARYIEGGQGAFNTNYKIWREGVIGAGANCSTYKSNSTLQISEIVRFDEHEVPASLAGSIILPGPPSLPATSAMSTNQRAVFPSLSSPAGDIAGWMFLNLHNGGKTCLGPFSIECESIYSAARPGFGNPNNPDQVRQSQNWVVVSMFAEGRYSVDFDATSLGNGCSPAPGLSSVTAIGPTGGVPVCPPNGGACVGNVNYTGSNATP